MTHPDPVIDAAIHAWRERSKTAGTVADPDQMACTEKFEELEVVAPNDKRFRRLCQRCNTVDDHSSCSGLGRIYACAAVQDDGTYIVLDRALAKIDRIRNALTVHEAIHHLGQCSGNDADPDHERETWWCGDPEECIEGAAVAAL